MQNRVAKYDVDFLTGIVRDRCDACGCFKTHTESQPIKIGWWTRLRRESLDTKTATVKVKWISVPSIKKASGCPRCADAYWKACKATWHSNALLGRNDEAFLLVPEPDTEDSKRERAAAARRQAEIEQKEALIRRLMAEKRMWDGK